MKPDNEEAQDSEEFHLDSLIKFGSVKPWPCSTQ